MAADVRIRPAAPADAAGIQRVARASWHAAYDPVLGAQQVDETIDTWYDPDRLVRDDIKRADRPFFVAMLESEVVGFVEAVPDEDDVGTAHLYRLYVAPASWRQGIGGSLLERIEAVLAERGYERLRLSVVAANDIGIGFYESNGFRRISVTHDHQFDVEQYAYQKPL